MYQPGVPVCVTVAILVAQYGDPAYQRRCWKSINRDACCCRIAASSPEKVYVIVYVPGVLVTKLISPVAAFIITPAGADIVPPACLRFV